MKPFTERTIHIIQQIPTGKVMTYGQIAKYAGSPRGARQVVRVLHTMSEKHNLPWHRVVNRHGEVSIPDEEGKYTQIALLKREGIKFNGAQQIPLDQYLHNPEVGKESLI